MPNYNFLNLSPLEFEDLSRDLLQKFLGLYLESFTSGVDGGIDLRHSYTNDKQLIIQAKRYESYDNLITTLKKEVDKVQKLKPTRYILTTSVPLNPKRKADIKKLFTPYILTTKDIFGQRDLNNLLGQYPGIEQDHFKLWLSSVNILEKILHSKIYNQSQLEVKKIKETLRLYVENDSYYQALDIIKDKRYVIISGVPGIGKTTLARVLAYHFLASNFDEFVYLADNIDDAFSALKDGVKQVFLFDDFLGRNFLDKLLRNNEEQKIVHFIEEVNKSNDKILILTTREYILAQAKQKYDLFNDPALEFAKCVIDLSQYTKLVKAKILYNHLFFSGIELPYLESLLVKKAYENIINHTSYSPRIIDAVTKPDVWTHIQPSEFAKKVLDYLTYPETIWRHVYENQITRFSQCLLANLLTMGTPLLMSDLKIQIQSFARLHQSKYGITYSELDFKKALKELENTFISISKDTQQNFLIDYANPSVQDFLVQYFADLEDHMEDVLASANYFNQFFRVFVERHNQLPSWARDDIHRIELSIRQQQIIIGRILNDFDQLGQSLLYRVYQSGANGSEWRKVSLSPYNKLRQIMKFFPLYEYPQLREFVLHRYQAIMIPESLNDDDFSDYMDLFEDFETECSFSADALIRALGSGIHSLKQVKELERIEMYYPSEFDEYVLKDQAFREKIQNIIKEESNTSHDFDIEDVLSDVTAIGEKLKLPIEECRDFLRERLDQYEMKNQADNAWEENNPNKPSPEKSDDQAIAQLFTSLITDKENIPSGK